MKLTELLKVVSPSTKIYVYNGKTFKFEGGATALGLLSMMEAEGTEGIVKHMTVGAGRLNLYLKKLD